MKHSEPFVLIDRLTTGDLDEAQRRDLFTWLDGEPLRWRRCALALLEARELEQVFGDWRAEVPRPNSMRTGGICASSFSLSLRERAGVRAAASEAPPQRSRWAGALALAASVMMAFSLGLVARSFWKPAEHLIVRAPSTAETQPSSKSTQAAPPSADTNGAVSEPEATTTTVAKATAPVATTADIIPPYVRSQWERRGYQLTSRHGRLPVVLPDGRRVTVPVDQLQLNYVGQQTY